MTITAGAPSSFAASATPCAWLPDENATTPRRRCSSLNWLMVLYAPRNLNAPPRCRFSHLKKTCAPTCSSNVREVTTGVRLAMPSSRCAAFWMLLKVIIQSLELSRQQRQITQVEQCVEQAFQLRAGVSG